MGSCTICEIVEKDSDNGIYLATYQKVIVREGFRAKIFGSKQKVARVFILARDQNDGRALSQCREAQIQLYSKTTLEEAPSARSLRFPFFGFALSQIGRAHV